MQHVPDSPSKPISVLHVVPWVSHGGVERRRLLLARGLGDGFVQSVLCLAAREPLRAELVASKCPVHELHPGADVGVRLGAGSLARAVAFGRRARPDIIHGAVFEGTTLAVAVGLATGARIVVEETSFADSRSWRGHALQRIYARAADRVVCVSPPVTQFVRRTVNPDPEKLVEIVNGIDAPPLPSPAEVVRLRSDLGLGSSFVIGSIGRMWDDTKRFSLLVEALKQLLVDGLDASLLLVGDGPDVARIRAVAQRLDIANRVVMPGYRRDVGTMLALMDVFALASRTESFALAIAEAMLARRPVVATAVGGVPAVLGDAGVLISPNPSAAEVASAIRSLAQQPARMQAIAEAGRVRAEQRFGEDRYVREVAALYRSLGRAGGRATRSAAPGQYA